MIQATMMSRLDVLLDCTPVVYEGEPLLLAELGNIVIERDVRKYVQRVDDPSPLSVERTVLLGPVTSYFDRWPVMRMDVKIPADLARFNRNLFQNYDQVRRFAFTQSDVAARIEEDLDVDVIVLLLIDGLSYSDWIDYGGVQSCLVEGPTITPVGFRNIVGKPVIASRLFKRGFRRRLGFSHWDRDNKLTDMLFYGFDRSTQMFKVSEFKEVLAGLDRLSAGQTYVQVLVNGLDFISHRCRGRPPVQALARSLYQDVFQALAERLQEMRVAALIYAAADHGILWRPQPTRGEELIVMPDERASAHRYARGALLVPHARQFSCHGVNYTVLAYPYVFKPLAGLEWGTHGGISFEESVVPFAKLEVI
jgi:hypothetical protein